MTMGAGIVLVHGYSGSPEDLGPLAAALRSRHGDTAATVVALPGHGAGAVPPFDDGPFKRHISQAAASYRKEGRKLILIGHSTGGALLLSFLAEQNVVPALLVLVAVPKRIDLSYLDRWSGHRTGKSSISFGDIAAAISFINRTGSRRIAGAFPVLALHGSDDELVPAVDASAWEQGTFEGAVRTVVIPGAGHHLFCGDKSGMAIDVVTRAVADALDPPSDQDDEVITRLSDVEPEAKRFLGLSPLSARHLAQSPSGQSVVGRGPVLSDRAESEPVFANIEITTRCNLSCSHCARSFVETAGEDMTLETFRRVLALLPHAYRVTLVGLGEPLLHPRIADLVAEAAGRGRRVGLVTNAMLLDREQTRALLDAGLHSIAFSIDAPDQGLASEIRPGTDLDRLIENIKSFLEIMKETRPISTAVFTAVSTRTARRLEELVDVIAGLGVHVLMLSDLNFEENEAKTLWKNVDAGTAGMVRKAVARAFSKKLPVLSVHGLEEFGLSARYERFLLIPPDSLYQRSTKRSWCCSPWQTAPVNVRGEVTICDCQPEAVAGNLLDVPFSAIWNGEAMKQYRQQMLSPEPPKKCLLCPRF